MAYTFDEMTVSDLHKDAYGFRPSAGWWAQWKSQNADDKQADWDYMCKLVEENDAAEHKAQDAAHERWTAHISRLMSDNGIDYATALRWDMEAMDVMDAGHYCYRWGLSYTAEDDILLTLKENA